MTQHEWPDDADGDVIRRLDASSFDFGQVHDIEFIVDFADWPPPEPVLAWLAASYGEPRLHDVPENGDGYVLFVVRDKLTYQLVTSVQKAVSDQMHRYGGICDSWGVLHGGSA